MTDNYHRFGLIGKPLSHSFSESYFTEKFRKLGLSNYQYGLYQLETIEELLPLIKKIPDLTGLNVTIPYKKEVLAFLDEISPKSEAIGAVNVIKIDGNKLSGYNTDYYGFKTSLLNWLPESWKGKALVLGTGGASLAVTTALTDSNITFQTVSRNTGTDLITYQQAKDLDILSTHELIINTTPLGMQPDIQTTPDLDYEKIGPNHYLFDLVYNPATTTFMKNGLSKGAKVKNGLEMLELQAEKAWEIWTK